MSRHVHHAKREDDARLRQGGRKEVVSIRISPMVRKLAKAHLARSGESLGEYLERLVLADLGDKMLPPSDG